MRRYAAVFLAISISSIAPASHGGARQNAISTNSAGNKDGPSKPPSATPVQIVRVEPSPQSVEAEAEKQSSEDRIFWLKPDAWVAIFTLSLTISTTALWFATKGMANDAREAIAAAQKSANAAEKSADAAVVAERAYVFPEIVNPGNVISVLRSVAGVAQNQPGRADEEIDITSDVSFVLKNLGKTPATIMMIKAGFGIGDRPNEPLIQVQEPILGTGESTRALTVEMWPSLTPNQAHFILGGSRQLTFSGVLMYADIWDKVQGLEFGFRFEPSDGHFVLDSIARIDPNKDDGND